MSPPCNCSFSPMMWQLPTVNSAHSGSLLVEVDLSNAYNFCCKPFDIPALSTFFKLLHGHKIISPQYYGHSWGIDPVLYCLYCALHTLHTVYSDVYSNYYWYVITFYCRSRLVPHTPTDDPVLTYYSSYWLLLRAHHLNRMMWIAQHRIHLCLLCLTCWLSLL